jgi:hypothetical protein
MTIIPMKLGPLKAEGLVIRRSAFHWFCEDGHHCRPREVVGFCTITLELAEGQFAKNIPMTDELDLQVAIASPYAGRLRLSHRVSPGGYLGLHGLHTWNADDVICHFEISSNEAPPSIGDGELCLLMLSGRRMNDLAGIDVGLLPGWHSRSRAWWGDQSGPSASLLCIGVCDASGIIRGNEIPFVETFEAVPVPAQVVFVPDHPVLPCAPVLLDQLLRTPAQNQAIAADLGAKLGSGRLAATSADWLFAGALLTWLESSPLRDNYDVLTPVGLKRLGPPNAILLSLSSESQSILRHKKLGYSLQMLRHRQASAGPAIRSWLASEFETVKRSVDDIHQDYLRLAEAVKKQTGARLFILNRMSSSGYEDIISYSPFDAPMSDTLENIAAKEMNLMLHELSEECDVSIIDVDALAADLGGAENLPDGIHHSAAMQAVLRSALFGEWHRMSANLA